jgi:hypothetical protein
VASKHTQPLVGSKERKIYHLESCFWARQISEWNRIYFDNCSDAVKNGYGACHECRPAEAPECQQLLRNRSVRVGSIVTIQYAEGKTRTFEMVREGINHNDTFQVPRDSSLGNSVFGARVGDKRAYLENHHFVSYKVIAIE